MTAQLELPMERLSFTVKDAATATGLSRSTIFAEIAAGKITTRKRGSTTLILREDLAAYLAALPKGTDK